MSLFADAAVTTLGAGMADMKLQVTNNRGMSVASKVNETPQGYHVTYVPTDPGTHSIHVKYGGIDVPGETLLLALSDIFTVCGRYYAIFTCTL